MLLVNAVKKGDVHNNRLKKRRNESIYFDTTKNFVPKVKKFNIKN